MLSLRHWALLFVTIVAFSQVARSESGEDATSSRESHSNVSTRHALLESSNLPIVVISTEGGKEIPDEPKVFVSEEPIGLNFDQGELRHRLGEGAMEDDHRAELVGVHQRLAGRRGINDRFEHSEVLGVHRQFDLG